MKTVALIYDHLARPETTGGYCLRALAELAHVEHFHPSQLDTIRRTGYDCYLLVDDGFDYQLPTDLRPQAYWAIDTHIDFERELARAASADVVWAAQKNGAEKLSQRLDRDVEWLPLACDPAIHAKQDLAKTFNVAFVGNLLGPERIRLVRRLQSEFADVHVGRHFFEAMAAVYSASRIVFNRSVVDDINMRVFEALASGSLLVTNHLADNGQEELFQAEKHLVTYSSDEELLDKIRFYLSHDTSREQIAAAGRQLVVAQHTYGQRMERVLAALPRPAQAASAELPKALPLGPDPHYYEFARPEILALVPKDARYVLDVGCASGELGRALKQRQPCTVYGLEINPAAASKASAWLDRVWVGDVESLDLDLPEKSLDAIVCGDVLEHLREPRAALRRLARLLKPDGQLVASLPNVAHHTVLRGLLEGNWSYQPAGLLDATHLRFFTAREIEKLFFRAGFSITHMEAVRGPGDGSLDTSRAAESIRLGRCAVTGLAARSIDALTAYQYLVTAVPAPSAHRAGLTSIVMLTKNQLEYTKLCLASIRSCTDEPYEVIVVDNGSTDGTTEYLRSVDGLRLIANPENRGFPAAVNQGIREARGDALVLLNNDCIVTTGWLARLQDALYSGPDVGLVGPYSNCVSGEQQIPVDYQLLEEIDGFAWEWAKSHAGERRSTDRLVAFCLLVQRAVVERVGLLDERFGLGNFEDDDFCRRASAAGFTLLIAEDAFVHHFGSVTYRQMGIDFGSLLDHNRQLFLEKWGTPSNSPSDLPATPPSSRSYTLAASTEPGLRLRLHQPTLSLAMIVRDSARTLAACLASIRPWVDEMIVVDTGSQDATIEIAEKYGAKIFHFPWCDDFAVARNESLTHATGEWLFWMDSDDTIDAENGRKLRALVDGPHQPEVLAYVAQVHCPHDVGGHDFTAVDHVKLFRNRPELRFEGRIHEQILPAINRLGGTVAWTDICVVHSGSDPTPAGQAKKLARDLRLLTLEDAERPNHPFTLFNLGMTHLELKHFAEAAQYLRRTIEVAAPHESHVPKAFSLLIQALTEVGQWDEARQQCDAARDRYPDEPELLFRAGVLAQHGGRPWEAEHYYHALLARTFEPRFRSLDRGILGYKTRQNLACLYADQNRHALAEQQWRQIVAERPDYRLAWRGLVSCLLKQGQTAAARTLVHDAKGLGPDPAIRPLLAAMVEESAGHLAAAQEILQQAVRESPHDLDLQDALCRHLFEYAEPAAAEAALQTLVAQSPDNAAALYNLATVRFRREQYAAAAETYEASLALRPNWPPASDQLATCYERLGRTRDATSLRTRAPQRVPTPATANGDRPLPPEQHSWYTSAAPLSAAVAACLAAAEREDSKLTTQVMAVPGMTSRRIRHLLNRLGELPGCHFLEVGTFYGATLLAASFDNTGTYLSVDDFSEFNEPDPRPTLYANLRRFQGHCHVDFREENCWRLPDALASQSVNVYFYDGQHTRETQREALLRFADVLADPCVLLIDDWNMECVQTATRAALDELGWSLDREWSRLTASNGEADSWWNGFWMAVVKKTAHLGREPASSSSTLSAAVT